MIADMLQGMPLSFTVKFAKGWKLAGGDVERGAARTRLEQ